MPDLNVNINELDPRANVLASDNLVSARVREGNRVSVQQLSNFSNIDYVLALAPQSIASDSIIKLVNNTNDSAFQVEVSDLITYFTGSTPFAATTTQRGLVELATDTEAQSTGGNQVITVSNLVSRSSTTFRAGLIETATFTEVNDGLAGNLAVTPASLAQRSATETRTGLIRVGTNLEVQEGASNSVAVTPLTLEAKRATDLVYGIVRFANGGDTITGTSGSLAVTPASLSAKVSTEGSRGIIELATASEGNAGVDGFRAMTPSTTRQAIDFRVPTASTTVAGKVELATDSESSAATLTSRAVTPSGLQQAFDDRGLFFNPYLDPNTVFTFSFNGRAANSWHTFTLNAGGIPGDTWYMAKVIVNRPQNNASYFYRRVGSSAGANDATLCGEVTGNSIGTILNIPIYLNASSQVQFQCSDSDSSRVLIVNLLGFYGN